MCRCCLIVDGETEHARAHEGGGERVHHTLVSNLRDSWVGLERVRLGQRVALVWLTVRIG